MASCTELYQGRKQKLLLVAAISSAALILLWKHFPPMSKLPKPTSVNLRPKLNSETPNPRILTPAPQFVNTAPPHFVNRTALETSTPVNNLTVFHLDQSTIVRWGGFGPERGQYNFTVVTGMMDVGREHWPHQARSYNSYLHNMERVMRLDVNIIAFVDAKARPFVDWMRRGRESRTRVIELRLQDLPYYGYRERIQEIMNSHEYRKDNELVQKSVCEAKYPDYNIVQWSKLYFVNRAIEMNPFQTDFFLWLDGGYGHGNDVHPHDGIWRPKQIFEFPDKVTFIELKPIESYKNKLDHLHKLATSVLAGLFWGGGKEALQVLYKMQQQLLADWMKAGIQDDDQTVYVLMYYKRPDLFHLVKGDWYDVFKKFN